MHTKISLDNGLRVIMQPMEHTRSVSVVFFVGTGGCYESENEAGISHFIEHLCFRGTEKRRSPRDISEPIEGVGGILNGGTDKEITTFWCKIASKHFNLAMDVLVDILRNSRFDLEDIERERHIITEEINMSLDNPRQRVDMLMDELMWPGTPLGRDIAGSKETVGAMTRQQIIDFSEGHLLPNNAIVSIAGDIDKDRVQQMVGDMLGDWRPKPIVSRLSNESEQREPRINVEFRDIEQAHISVGVQGISIFHPDRFAIDLVNIVLGEGMSSRLFVELREKQGLTYEVGSSADHFADMGTLIVNAGVDPSKVDNAIESIIDQLVQVKETLSEEELSKAKEMVKGRLMLSLENSRNVAGWLGAQEMLTGQILTADDIAGLVDAVSVSGAKRIVDQLLIREKLNVAIVGPIKDKKPLDRLLANAF